MFGSKSTEQLLAETNALLRELIAIASGQPLVRPEPKVAHRLRTDADVAVTGRSHQLEMERAREEALVAPWRGQDSPQTSQTVGSVSVESSAATSSPSEP